MSQALNTKRRNMRQYLKTEVTNQSTTIKCWTRNREHWTRRRSRWWSPRTLTSKLTSGKRLTRMYNCMDSSCEALRKLSIEMSSWTSMSSCYKIRTFFLSRLMLTRRVNWWQTWRKTSTRTWCALRTRLRSEETLSWKESLRKAPLGRERQGRLLSRSGSRSVT